MTNKKIRLYRLDGDRLEVGFAYDAHADRYFGDYPDFSETPRYTPSGRPWVNATGEGCEYADLEYGDCGSCKHFHTEKHGDLIGICKNNALKVAKALRKEESI